MKRYRVILDTNVIVAALRSQSGASRTLFNERHLRPAREFGIEVITPVELLQLMGEIK